MYICDGSVLAANLGVNPSLTICALTERAMSFIPPALSAIDAEHNKVISGTQGSPTMAKPDRFGRDLKADSAPRAQNPC
jgi:hypothetical protein